MSYTPSFTPQYADGWEDLPIEETPITATALNAYDDAIENIENYLASDDSQANIADAYDETATYAIGAYVIHNGTLYKCTTAISEAEEWDSTHWTACIVTDEMGSGGGGGTTVVANPSGEATDELEKVLIGSTIYDIPSGGGGSDVSITPTLSTGTKIADFEIDGTSGELYAPTGGGGNANIWTGTQAEYEAQASQIADDTVVLITDDEERTQAFDVYSTDEQVIGTWIDGSTIYRKTITGLSIQLNGTTWVNYNPSISIDKLINLHAYYIPTDGLMTCAIAEYQYNPSVGIQLTAVQGYNRTVNVLTIEYTKTTD